MSDSLYKLKSGKLQLKGESSSKHKKKKSKKHKKDKKDGDDRKRLRKLEEEDTRNHGGWWAATEFNHITGPISIEFGGNNAYLRACDDGGFTLGAPHDQGDGPNPEEVLLAIRINDDH